MDKPSTEESVFDMFPASEAIEFKTFIRSAVKADTRARTPHYFYSVLPANPRPDASHYSVANLATEDEIPITQEPAIEYCIMSLSDNTFQDVDTTSKDFSRGIWVKHARTAWGMSTSQLAEKADVRAQYIARLESGERSPSKKLLAKLEEILETEYDSVNFNMDDILRELKEALGELKKEQQTKANSEPQITVAAVRRYVGCIPVFQDVYLSEQKLDARKLREGEFIERMPLALAEEQIRRQKLFFA